VGLYERADVIMCFPPGNSVDTGWINDENPLEKVIQPSVELYGGCVVVLKVS
jgi:hypothetical protein